MKKTHLWARALAAALLIFGLFAFAAAEEEEKPRVYLYFFHNNPCEACQEVDKMYDIASETDSWDEAHLIINEFKEYTSDFNYGVEIIMQWFGLEEKPKAPFVVVGNTVLEGYDAMRAGLKEAVAEAVEEEYIFSEDNVYEYGSLKDCPSASEEGINPLYIALPAAAAVLLIVLIAVWRRGRGKKNTEGEKTNDAL